MSFGLRLRRLALLLALLPELLMLGLGQGVVLCIAPGGHVQVEVETSVCCAEADAAAHGPGAGASEHERDCGPCSDVGTTLDPHAAQAPEVQGVELPAASAALPEDALALRGAVDRTMPRLRDDPDGGQGPPHLLWLRSVMLLC